MLSRPKPSNPCKNEVSVRLDSAYTLPTDKVCPLGRPLKADSSHVTPCKNEVSVRLDSAYTLRTDKVMSFRTAIERPDRPRFMRPIENPCKRAQSETRQGPILPGR